MHCYTLRALHLVSFYLTFLLFLCRSQYFSRCPVDPTVVFYKGPHTIQRFSFKAFKFLAKGKIFVYLHCHLIVCNVTDPTSRCAIGCLSSSFGRFRRDASPSAEAELTQGPFLLEKKPAALPLESGEIDLLTFVIILNDLVNLVWSWYGRWFGYFLRNGACKTAHYCFTCTQIPTLIIKDTINKMEPTN